MMTVTVRDGLPRVAIICDLHEESWPSMDLFGDMLMECLTRNHADEVAATRICPRMRRRFSRLPFARRAVLNADRMLNRHWDYPLLAGRVCRYFDVFHVVDHSYAQLLHALPGEHTLVYCHDIDAFRCIFSPRRGPRSAILQKLARRTLAGLQQAKLVACASAATREELLAFKLLPPERVTVNHPGVHPACSPDPDPDADAAFRRLLGRGDRASREILLHVGSVSRRKRIDTLLSAFALVREVDPECLLVRVGGPLNREQSARAEALGLAGDIVTMPFLDRRMLSAAYRGASLLLQPSEREGFGLPVAEAMACGTPVVASDLSVLREVGGDAATYCPVGAAMCWKDAVVALLNERRREPDQWLRRRMDAIARAALFSWQRHAQCSVRIYQRLLFGSRVPV